MGTVSNLLSTIYYFNWYASEKAVYSTDINVRMYVT